MASGHVFYFAIPYDLSVLFAASGQTDRAGFIPAWKAIDDANEVTTLAGSLPPALSSPDAVVSRLGSRHVAFVARRPVPGTTQESLYLSAVTVTTPPVHFLVEITLQAGVASAKLAVKSQSQTLAPMACAAIEGLLRN
jgi:hypothetical protein